MNGEVGKPGATHLGLRSATPDDGEAIARIYNHYVENTVITFEETAVDGGEIGSRIRDCLAADLPWLIAERDGRTVGFAYASKWKGRCAYRFAAEVTVYVDRDTGRGGIGSALYEELIARLRIGGMHALMAGIALPNGPSVAIHEKFGFEKVAHFRQVGRKFGRWIDVGYWELLLQPAELAD